MIFTQSVQKQLEAATYTATIKEATLGRWDSGSEYVAVALNMGGGLAYTDRICVVKKDGSPNDFGVEQVNRILGFVGVYSAETKVIRTENSFNEAGQSIDVEVVGLPELTGKEISVTLEYDDAGKYLQVKRYNFAKAGKKAETEQPKDYAAPEAAADFNDDIPF